MRLGAAYYPEFYPKEQWKTDVEGMAELGFNVVRMAEFAWCRLEPQEGQYDFTWLDEIIALCAAHGIQTILGTPSGAPPQWIVNRYPDLPRTDAQNNPNHILGGFGNFCKNHPQYRAHIRNMVTEMAKHYKDNPNVILYQIDNEMMGEHCFCDNCTKAYRVWAKKKHKTPEHYNRTLMTMFQGREISSFEDIQPMTSLMKLSINPSVLLEYQKFVSDTFVEFCREQVEAIHAVDPNAVITTNYNTLFNEFDHFEMSEFLDATGCDTYPKADGDYSLRNAMKLDMCRAAKKSNFWILEQQCSPVAFREYNYPVEPMEARLFTYKSIAHGADGIVYFRYNVTHQGGERYGAGILRHDCTKGRTFYELKRTSQELATLAPYLNDSKPKAAKVAMVYSNLSCWGINEGRKTTKDLDYIPQLRALYDPLRLQNISIDYVNSGDDLSGYDVVFAPAMVVVREQDAKWLSDYVANGGNCVVGVGSGMLDEYSAVSKNFYLGGLRDMLGIRVTEWVVPYPDKPHTMHYAGKSYPADLLNMVMELDGATALATYETGFYQGTPAVTVNHYGKGKAYYLGIQSDRDFVQQFTRDQFNVIEDLGIQADFNHHVEVKIREKDGNYLYLVMNHLEEAQDIVLTKPFVNALTGERMHGKVSMPAYDVLTLRDVD